MPSSGMSRRVALVRTEVSEERGASIIRVAWIGELRTTLELTSNRRRCEEILILSSCETSVLTKATRRNIPEDNILHSHRSENLKSKNLIHDVILSFKFTHPVNSFRVPLKISGKKLHHSVSFQNYLNIYLHWVWKSSKGNLNDDTVRLKQSRTTLYWWTM
jgi:hypothetical protein